MDKPNVFLIVMDAVRPDHLSCYGHSSSTSPSIDKMAEDGVLFENVFSAAPWSPDSHASMFTGLYPSNHGVLGENLYLSRDTPSLPQIFNSEGYRTLGICPNAFVGPHFGFHHGFDKFIGESLTLDLLKKHPWNWLAFGFETDFRALVYRWTYHSIIFELMKKWITNSRKKNRPFFIFINYFDAHLPHNPPLPFRKKFLRGQYKNVDLKKVDDCFNKRFGLPYITEEVKIENDEWEFVKSLYDAEIAYIDYFIGKALDYLKRYELLDRTFVLITSDHGENFGDHRLAGHAFCVYDTLLHIPLIIRFPQLAPNGRRISSLSSTVDIFPTLLSILGKDFEYDTDGVNLIPFLERNNHDYVFAEYGPPTPQIDTLRRLCPGSDSTVFDKTWQCIRSPEFKYVFTSTGEEEFYNLKADRDETENIIEEIPEKRRKEFKSIISRELPNARKPTTKKLTSDEETLKRLRALGYF